MNLVFDIETDGFVSACTQIHCIGIYDLDTKQTLVFNDEGDQDPISRGVQMLMDADSIIVITFLTSTALFSVSSMAGLSSLSLFLILYFLVGCITLTS